MTANVLLILFLPLLALMAGVTVWLRLSARRIDRMMADAANDKVKLGRPVPLTTKNSISGMQGSVSRRTLIQQEPETTVTLTKTGAPLNLATQREDAGQHKLVFGQDEMSERLLSAHEGARKLKKSKPKTYTKRNFPARQG